ncbi:NADP-dependent oxidoreductase [Actinomadura hibisca]|uniref:NADP-dependent oxidoreductase n=1 Tax=Actinomadura hibisca TaxID=68565 RepID=UPI00082A5F98|nr:NADP-dependent oxidoreductase [Actinomadura hibisca]
MRAVAVAEFGATPVLTDLPRPDPGPGEVLVKLVAAGLNPIDWKVADGLLKDAVEHSFPLILGSDGAGVVEAVGADVTAFRPGDQVYGSFQDVSRGLGSYAEFAVAPADGTLAAMPEGMIYSQAAAVPTASMTAWNAVRIAGADEGRTLLILGATGGVGQSAVQLGARNGARVIATARPDTTEEMRKLGASETVDYTGGGLGERVRALVPDGLDAVLDLVGSKAQLDEIVPLMRPGGTIVSTAHALNTDALEAQELRGVNMQNEASGDLLRTLADLIDAGELTIRIDEEVSLRDAPAALARNKAGGARGKTVIRL